MSKTPFGFNPATTAELVLGYFGGAVMLAGEWSLVFDGTVELDDNTINYVELNPETCVVSANAIGFAPERIPMMKAATMDGAVSGVSDWHPAFVPGQPGEDGAIGPMGVQGPQGEGGPAGPQGDEGLAGPQGLQGIEGLQGPAGPQGAEGPAGPAGAPGLLHGDGAPVDGVTGLDSVTKIYQNDIPSEFEAVLYVNIDPASPSTNPQWRGVNTINP